MPAPLFTPARSKRNDASSDPFLGTVGRRLMSLTEKIKSDSVEAQPQQKTDHEFFNNLTKFWSPLESGEDQEPARKKARFQSQAQIYPIASRGVNQASEYDALEQELKEQFRQHGTDLSAQVTKNLTRAQKAAKLQIAKTEEKDNAVAEKLSTILQDYSRPFSESLSKVQSTVNGSSQKESIHVGEAVAKLRSQLATVEKELTVLWNEWETAQEEVDAAIAALSEDRGNAGSSLEKIQADMAKELDAAMNESRRDMQACEAEFGKEIALEHDKLIQAMISAPSQYD